MKKTNRKKRGVKKQPLLKKRVAKLEKTVKATQNYYTLATGFTNLSWNGGLFALNHLAAGDGVGTRDGQSQVNTYLEMRIRAEGRYVSGLPQASAVRVMVFWDYENSITQINEVLQYAQNTYSLMSHLNQNENHRFKIIHDCILNQTEDDSQNYYTIRLSLKDKLSTYSGTAAGDLQKNSLKFIAFSDIDPSVASTLGPSFEYTQLLKYHD